VIVLSIVELLWPEEPDPAFVVAVAKLSAKNIYMKQGNIT